jgi:hypothetical protein
MCIRITEKQSRQSDVKQVGVMPIQIECWVAGIAVAPVLPSSAAEAMDVKPRVGLGLATVNVISL